MGNCAAFQSRMCVLSVSLSLDTNPAYTSLVGDVPFINVHLETEADADYTGRVRRQVDGNYKMTEVETTTPPLSSSSYRETTAVPRQPTSRAPIAARLTMTSTATTKMTDSATPLATAAPSSSVASMTTEKTTVVKVNWLIHNYIIIINNSICLCHISSNKTIQNQRRITLYMNIQSNYLKI